MIFLVLKTKLVNKDANMQHKGFLMWQTGDIDLKFLNNKIPIFIAELAIGNPDRKIIGEINFPRLAKIAHAVTNIPLAETLLNGSCFDFAYVVLGKYDKNEDKSLYHLEVMWE